MPIINITIPPLTRGLLAGLVVLTILNAGARYRSWLPDPSSSFNSRVHYAPYFTIVPGTSILYPWVFLTATLAEQNAVGLVITGASLFYGGRYLERAWSSREYTKFILLIALIPNLLTLIFYYIGFALTSNEELITTAISGGIAIQAAFLVAFKQLIPEHTVQVFRGFVRMRVKHFPALFLLANTIAGLVLGTETAMMLAWFGFLTSWTYLRFYRTSPSLFTTATGQETGTGTAGATSDYTDVKGDASDTFAFAAFFPDVVQPPIALVADAVYKVLVTIRICTPFSASDVAQASARGGGADLPSLLNPGRGRAEAERRRNLALRVLDQRLNAQNRPTQARTMEAVVSAQADKKLEEKELPQKVEERTETQPGVTEQSDVD